MKTYINLQQTHVPSYNLEVVSNAYNKLNEGHIQAIQAQSELQSAIAQLDLNETEEDFRQSLVNEINQTVQDNTRYNNAYFALSDIIAKAGNINSNPELIGRLKAQQAYKANIAAIDARTDLRDDVKQYAKVMSPYYYRDKVTGELINNGVWKPGYNPVKSIDINEILKTLPNYISPDEGGYSGPVTFLNADGTTSNTWTPGTTLGVLNQMTNQWERVPKEKIKTAWDAALAANPEIMASLKQDYLIDNWKYDTNGDNSGNIVGQDGSKIGFDEYVNRIIEPYAKAKSYYNTTSSLQYQNDILKSYATLKANGGIGLGTPKVSLTTTGNPIEVENDIITRTAESINNSNANFRSLVAQRLQGTDYAVDLNMLDVNKPEQTRQTLVNAGLPVEEIDAIMQVADRQAKLNYSDNKYYENILSTMSSRGQAARKLVDDLSLGNEIDKDYYDTRPYRRWVREYGSIIDRAFANDNIYFGTESADEFNTLIASLGGLDTIRNLGFKIIDNGGKKYIGLDKSNSNQFVKLSNAIKLVIDRRTFGQNIADSIKNKKDIYYLDENGTIREYSGQTINDVDISGENIFNTGSAFYNRMNNISTRQTPQNFNTLIAETKVTPGGTGEEMLYRQYSAGAMDTNTRTLMDQNANTMRENLVTALATKGVINTNVRKVSTEKKNSNGVFTMLTGKDVVDLEIAMQNLDIASKIETSILEASDGSLYTVCTIPTGTGKDKSSIKIVLEDINTPVTNALRNDPARITSGQIFKSYYSNKPEQIAFYTDDLGNSQHILLYPSMDGSKNFYLGYNDEIDTSRIISYNDAISLKMIYNALTTLNNSNLDVNQKVATRNMYVNVLNQMINGYIDENGIKHSPIPLAFPNYGSNDITGIIDEIIGW